MAFIPKAGKSGHARANCCRPISLTSIMLKTWNDFEFEIRNRLAVALLDGYQHRYIKGRSADTALHKELSAVERARSSTDNIYWLSYQRGSCIIRGAQREPYRERYSIPTAVDFDHAQDTPEATGPLRLRPWRMPITWVFIDRQLVTPWKALSFGSRPWGRDMTG